ncbi:unnamed protein product [Adineta steineri]|uniref:Uncharacterized protein n=1 Tax=Adineta steineri TaxID=433720 RepID=A0A813PRH4_9BILA|nr:unnamed protein product [Adineta steineri]CAF4029230.1 unnamed protein product [Adineta steineri]
MVQIDEPLHPLWLGILMLFSVMIILGILCFMRRKCGSQIHHVFKVLCCGSEHSNEHRVKTSKHSSMSTAYNWAPVYNPAPHQSPKLYTLVRNIQMTSFDREQAIQETNNSDDNVENDIFSIPDESDQIKTSTNRKISQSSQGSNLKRNCETARKFYASMRRTSQCQTTSSNNSTTNDSLLITHDRLIKTNHNDKLKFFHTTRFFNH